jgi:Raf kinase inhibitor-like YbhB/YbcL family protein
MTLRSDSFEDGGPIPSRNAFCPHPGHDGPVNLSPHLEWDNVPEGTESFVVLCVDVDAPASREGVGVAGQTIAFDRPRAEFVHWVLADVPGVARRLHEGEDSTGVSPRGKPLGMFSQGVRGRNSYTEWFADDDEMRGVYAGYDGPCPPFNDERAHRYVFTVYALDVETLGLPSDFTIGDVRRAMMHHTLGGATITGTYTLNPDALTPEPSHHGVGPMGGAS